MKKLEISKEDLKYNLEKIKKIAIENHHQNSVPKIIGVVKGNGMGLGLKEYAEFLVENGIEILAVCNSNEAIILRESGIQIEILMLSPVAEKEELRKLIENNITLTISSLENLIQIEEIGQENDGISEVKAHIKIDTGFGRYGIIYTNIEEILNIFKQCKKTKIIYTFFENHG